MSGLEDLVLTSVCQVGVRYYNVVAILVIDLAVLVVRVLGILSALFASVYFLILTSTICLTWTSGALIGGLGGGR